MLHLTDMYVAGKFVVGTLLNSPCYKLELFWKFFGSRDIVMMRF